MLKKLLFGGEPVVDSLAAPDHKVNDLFLSTSLGKHTKLHIAQDVAKAIAKAVVIGGSGTCSFVWPFVAPARVPGFRARRDRTSRSMAVLKIANVPPNFA